MKKWIAVIVFCFCLIGAGQTAVYADSGVQVTDENGQIKIYENEIQNLTLDGEKKDLGKAPGIVLEDEVMLTHTAVFKKMLGMKVTYSGKAGTVVLQTKEHTMKFTKNLKTAILDGKEIALEIAPVSVKYLDTGVNTILLPTKTIAQVWEYTYSYDRAEKEISLSREKGMDLTYAGLSFHYLDAPVNILIDGKKLDYPMSGLIVDNYNMVPVRAIAAKTGVKYSYNGTNKQVTLTKGKQKVIMTMNSTVATVNGSKVTLPIAPAYVKNKESGVGCNMVPAQAFAEYIGLGYEWDNDTVTSEFFTPDEYQISMKLPEACQNENYSTEDDYFNHQFKIIFDGSYKSFFTENGIKNPYYAVKSVSVSQQSGTTTVVLKSDAIKGYQLKEEDGILYIKVGTPKEIYDKIVVLDAGHGGTDPGAAGNGIYEKNVTLSIINAARNYFNMDEGLKVYYTRTTNAQAGITAGSNGLNSSSSLSARTKLANDVQADLFLSVHINSATSTSARGTEVYYSANNNKKNSGGLTASKLAQLAYNNMVTAVGSTKRGVKTANFYVVRHTDMPAILIETAFISNKSDAAILKSSSKIDQMGEAVYNTVVQAFNSYPTKR